MEINLNFENNSNLNSPKNKRNSPNKKIHSPRKNSPSHFQIQKMTQKIHRNLKSLDFIHIEKEKYSLENYIKILKEPLNVRSAEDIITIKHFLETSELEKKFEEDGIEKINHEKMFVIFSTFVKFSALKQNFVVYNKNDVAKNIFIILNGEVELFNIVIKEKMLSGYEYFLKILEYLKNDNKQLFNLTKEINKNVFDLKEIDDQNELKMILLKIILIHERIRKINKEIFDRCKINYENWEIDFEEMSNLKILDLVKSKLAKIEDDIEKFIFLNDEKEKKKVFLYEFEKTDEISNSKIFGNVENEKYKEKAIVKSNEISLCVLPLEIYNEYVKEEKENIKIKQINFLFEKFFFKKMVKRKFEREFFHFFKKEIYKKGQIIIKENEPIEFIYFIEKGFCSLSLKKSLIEIYNLNNYLNLAKIYKKKNLKFDFNLNLPKIQNENEFIKKIKEKNYQNILILGENEIIGNECVFFDINNLFTVKVESEKIYVFKIYKKYFQNIFTKDEIDVCKDYEIACYDKIERIQKRLNNINEVNFGIIERKVENNKNNININNNINKNNNENNNENNENNNENNENKEKKKYKNDFNNEKSINLENSYFFNGNLNENSFKKKRKSNYISTKKLGEINVFKKRNKTEIFNEKFSTIDDSKQRKKNLFPKIRSFEDRLFEKVEKLKKSNNSILISNINNSKINNKSNINKYEESSFLTSLNSKIINNNNNNSNINEHFPTEISKINNIFNENENNNENNFNLPLIKNRIIRSPKIEKHLKKFKVFDNGIFEDDYLYNNSLLFSYEKNSNKINNNFDFNYDNNKNIIFSNPNELFLNQFKKKQLFFKMLNEKKKNNIKYKKEIMEKINEKYYS